MYKKGLSVWFIVILLIISLLAVGCGGKTEDKAAAPEKVKVGVILPLTGNLAQLGQEVNNGFDLATEFVNAKGGVWGKQVELVKGDAPDATAATSEANRLITREGVKVIAGSYASAVSFAASEVAERNKVIYWEQGAVADNISDRHLQYFFRLIYKASDLGRASAQYVAELAPQLKIDPKDLTVAIMNEDSNYGTAVAAGVKDIAAKTGMKVVVHEQYSSKTTDLSSVVLKIKQAKPDAIIATSYVPDGILFWRQAKENGVSPKIMIGNGGCHNMPDFAAALGDDVNGVFNAGTSSTFNPDGLLPDAKALFVEFQTKYEAKYGRKPTAHAAMGFNAMYLLLNQVLPQAGAMDAEKIKTAAKAMDMPTGSTIVGWGVKFDADGQNTRAFPMIDQWQSQKVVTIYPKEFGLTDKVTVPLPAWGKRADVGK